MQTRSTHVTVDVLALRAPVDWHAEVLDFEVRYAWLSDDPHNIDFVPSEDASFPVMVVDPAPCGVEVNFRIEDVDLLLQRLKYELDVVEPPFDAPTEV